MINIFIRSKMKAPLKWRVRQLTNTIIVNPTLLFDILWSMNRIKLFVVINLVGGFRRVLFMQFF